MDWRFEFLGYDFINNLSVLQHLREYYGMNNGTQEEDEICVVSACTSFAAYCA